MDSIFRPGVCPKKRNGSNEYLFANQEEILGGK